ncbi:: hypothetical protein [Arcticibacter svalbardensis MN12-7]|uniref:DUF4270 domain-containing protein n=1 Tax=Arcticibacter svalbardensis MN12-7 TaxID=1150600 RepID=R9GSB7_9SPHI|nr:DUF4270 domain-containing protein [Arcticibacter svalbardensis]EOR94737.1 : hypothetical protein [Arcticibacter svalbardensis MN12-7]
MNYLSRSLFILVSFFALSSCQKTDNIGLDIDPQDTINSSYLEEYNIGTVTVREDSVLAYNLAQFPVGLLTDPIFGRTQSDIAVGLALPSTALTFGTSPQLDSGVLVLKYGKEFFGDSINSTYSVTVHQLDEEYKPSSQYFNTRNWKYKSTEVIGSLSNVRHFTWNDSVFVRQIIKGAADTLLKVQPQLRIPMDRTFMETHFLNADPSNFLTDAAFKKYIQGLYVTVKKEQADGKGGVIFFDLATTGVSGLELYYRSTNTSATLDTTKVTFAISNTTTSASIKHDYTGTPVKTQLDYPSQSFSTVYTQPMGGLRTKITMPSLEQIRALGKIAINKAELVIYVENQSETSIIENFPRLALYTTDIAGQRQVVDQVSYLGVPYDKTNKRYIFNVSTYVQRLINGKSDQYNTYLAPLDEKFLSTTTANISPVLSTAGRTALAGENNSDMKIKLNIYYTRPD